MKGQILAFLEKYFPYIGLFIVGVVVMRYVKGFIGNKTTNVKMKLCQVP